MGLQLSSNREDDDDAKKKSSEIIESFQSHLNSSNTISSPISIIHFRIYTNYICLYMVIDSKEIWIEFKEHRETGCQVSRSDVNRIVESEENFTSVACNYFGEVLDDLPTLIEELAIVILYGNDEDRGAPMASATRAFENLETLLKNRSAPLKIQSFTTTVTHEGQVLQILPFIDSTSLRRLTINKAKESNYDNCEEILEMEGIVELEQFLRAEEFSINGFGIDPKYIKNVAKFKEAQIAIREISYEDFKELREELQVSPTFQYLQLRFLENHAEQHFENNYGPPSQEVDQLGHKRRQWYFKTPVEDTVESIIFFSNFILISKMNSDLVSESSRVFQ